MDLRHAFSIIVHGQDFLVPALLLTLRTSLIATAAAAAIGLPIGLAIGLGRFRGRATLHVLANASLGFPPVLLGLILWLVALPPGPLGGLRLGDANHLGRMLCLTQGLLALPYVVALSAGAMQQLGPDLPAQARLLGAGRVQVGVLALREAWIGVIAAVCAGLGASLAEVGAQAVLTGIYPGFYTLAGAVMFHAGVVDTPAALAFAMVLLALMVVVIGAFSLLQHASSSRRARPPRRRPLRAPAEAAA
jgi:tungstate transport system permease protein